MEESFSKEHTSSNLKSTYEMIMIGQEILQTTPPPYATTMAECSQSICNGLIHPTKQQRSPIFQAGPSLDRLNYQKQVDSIPLPNN